jgi:hypothetical protein
LRESLVVITLASISCFAEDVELVLSPRELEYEVIKAKLACELNDKWHSRLPYIHWSNVVRNTHYVCFGAKPRGVEIGPNGEGYVAVGIWSSPVAQNRFKYGKQMLELRRMAISSECPRNTATHMLGFMRRWILANKTDVAMLVSYQDTEVHQGTIYKADNWVEASLSNGLAWNTEKRKRNKEQSLAPKIRWEYKLRDYKETETEDK